uniref:Uncharacterized protein n=1 Tax=Tanacetum cinerariifolium TaxID=118510 RepID=A0A699IYE6_TANCI|nr:hypothetical protein [Tanacetum cinerariifolium]
MCELACQIVQKKQEEKRIEEEQAAKARYWKIPACCDDDDDYDFAITPVLSTEEPIDFLSMGDEHLDTIPATESDEVIKSNVKDLVPIPSEFEVTPILSTEELDNSLSMGDEHVDTILATKSDEVIKSSVKNLIPIPSESEGIPEPLNANPTPSSDFKTKSSSTSLNSLLEETNTFDNSLLEFETSCFDVEEISSGSTTTHSDISLPEYDVFHDDHVKEISSGSPTTHSDSSLYASFIFDFLINPFPPADRSDFYEFADELIPFISPPDYDCFLFMIEPNSRDCTMDVVKDISLNKEQKFIMLCSPIPPFN